MHQAAEAVQAHGKERFVRVAAFVMICGAGLNVLPAVAAQSVPNCLALLDAQQPFMVKAGCSRLVLLMRLEAGRQKAVEVGAPRKLLSLVKRPDLDAGVMDQALSALEVLAACEAGVRSLADEGAAETLAALAARQRSSMPANEAAVRRVQHLLVALAQP